MTTVSKYRKKRPAARRRPRKYQAGKYSPVKYQFPFPAMYKCKLVYTGWVADGRAGNGTTSNTSYGFKLNSCHDPYDGITGSYNVQPYYWDQISAIYKRYLVTSAKVEIRFSPPTQTHAMSVMRPTTVSTTPTDFQLEESRPNAVKRVISTGGNGAVLKAYYKLANIQGVTSNKYANDDLYAAVVGGEPTLISYAHVLNVNANNTTTDNPLAFNIKITQYVTMFDRSIVSGS